MRIMIYVITKSYSDSKAQNLFHESHYNIKLIG